MMFTLPAQEIDKGKKEESIDFGSIERAWRSNSSIATRIVQWKKSAKALTIDQVAKIMLESKSSGDFERAFEHSTKGKIS